MKKSLSILLILLLIFNSCGFIFVYYQALYIIRELASRETSGHFLIKNVRVVTVKSNSQILEFIEDGEFRIGNEMYDIIRTVSDNDLIHIYCFQDHQEEILNKIFNNQIDDQTPIHSGLDNLAKLLQMEALPIEPLINSQLLQTVFFGPKPELSYESVNQELLFPPPCSSDLFRFSC